MAPPPLPPPEVSPTPQPVVFVDAPTAAHERPDPHSPVVEAPAEVVPVGCWEGDREQWTIKGGANPRVVLPRSGRSAPLRYRASDRLFGFRPWSRHEALILFRLDGDRLEAYPHKRRGRGEWRRSATFVLSRC